MSSPKEAAEVSIDAPDSPTAIKKRELSEEERRRLVEAYAGLPPLTRAVLLLARLDNLSYNDIGVRCGISVDEVTVRFADGLIAIGRYMDGKSALRIRVRRAFLPWRDAWARARAREGDRSLAPWLAPEDTPGKRSLLEWMAWGYGEALR